MDSQKLTLLEAMSRAGNTSCCVSPFVAGLSFIQFHGLFQKSHFVAAARRPLTMLLVHQTLLFVFLILEHEDLQESHQECVETFFFFCPNRSPSNRRPSGERTTRPREEAFRRLL